MAQAQAIEACVAEAMDDVVVQTYPTTAQRPVYHETMPDGTQLDPTATYTISVRAHNVVGEAFSTEASYSLVLNDDDTVAELSVGKLTGGVADITKIGSTYYVLLWSSLSGGTWWVEKVNSSWVSTGSWQVGMPDSPRLPAIGNDGTNIEIVRAGVGAFAGIPIVQTFNPSTGAQIGASLQLAGPWHTGFTSVSVGSFDIGVTRIIVSTVGDIRAFNVSGGRQEGQDWERANATNIRGMAWDGTRFQHLDSDGGLWQYSTVHRCPDLDRRAAAARPRRRGHRGDLRGTGDRDHHEGDGLLRSGAHSRRPQVRRHRQRWSADRPRGRWVVASVRGTPR
ncbi:MAG TPA: hypothetical protein VNT92_05455 [Acidimicrobiia bacterium]|nr:hypothetical protein [Acidimicrobiia bacterium]